MPLADTWIQIAVACVAAASLITTVVIYRNSMRRKDYHELKTREEKQDKAIGELQNNVSRIGSELRHAPTHEDMGRLHEKLNAISREVSETHSSMKANMRQTEMIQQHLMEKKHG